MDSWTNRRLWWLTSTSIRPASVAKVSMLSPSVPPSSPDGSPSLPAREQSRTRSGAPGIQFTTRYKYDLNPKSYLGSVGYTPGLSLGVGTKMIWDNYCHQVWFTPNLPLAHETPKEVRLGPVSGIVGPPAPCRSQLKLCAPEAGARS